MDNNILLNKSKISIIIIILIILILIYKRDIVLRYYSMIYTMIIFNLSYSNENRFKFVDNIYLSNKYYKIKYNDFYNKFKNCSNDNYDKLPYLEKDELIKYNDELITPPYKKCNLLCKPNCILDPIIFDNNCTVGQSTGGTSGKSTFIWMNKQEAYIYIYTFITSFKKNGYNYGDKIIVFYPSNSYFTNEYEQTNNFLSYINVNFLTFKEINKEKTIEFVDYINNNYIDFIVIFPFVLLQLCINIKRYNIKLTHYPKNINLSGEFLLNCSLNFCKKIFINSNIENTYGAVEFGEIAHQIKDNKNVFEVFNEFCYLENKEDKIVVSSFINKTFPIIRYVMEDVGKIVNKDGKQYIYNLIGKNTNQIIINNYKFTSLDIDSLIDTVNINNNIISIVTKYDDKSIDINYIIYNEYSEDDKFIIYNKTINYMNEYFKDINYNISYINNYDHDYLKKFKIIIKKDNSDSEPVGGFYKY
jgi:phenylacetate-coenzyme A ligase PaaK-like adenylate-forming protein